MKYSPYSNSKLSCHEECPFIFKCKYIDKIKISSDPKHFEKGNWYHWILQYFPEVPPDAPWVWKHNGPEKQKEFEVYLRAFLKNPRTKFLLTDCESLREYNFQFQGGAHELIAEQLDKWKSTAYGFIDLMAFDHTNPKNLIIVDWKSSKQSYTKIAGPQLAMYALWGFMFTNVDTVTVEYGFVQDNLYEQLVYSRDKDFKMLLNQLINRIDHVENDTEFKRKVTKNCKWCDYLNVCNPFTNRS